MELGREPVGGTGGTRRTEENEGTREGTGITWISERLKN